jgi:hypothetical protein
VDFQSKYGSIWRSQACPARSKVAEHKYMTLVARR